MRQLNRCNIKTIDDDLYTLEKAVKQLGYNVEQISSKKHDNIKRCVPYDKSRKTIYIPSWADQMMTSKVSDDTADFICEVVPSSERQDHDDSIIALECHNCNTMFTAHISDHDEYKKITHNHGIRCPECKSDFDVREISIFKFKWFRYWRGLRQSIRDKIRI